MFFRILKRAIILISKNLWKFLEWQRIYSCNLKHAFQTDDQRNKKTKKIQQRLKMLVDLHPFFFTKGAGHVIKVVLCNPLPLQKVQVFLHKNKLLEVS